MQTATPRIISNNFHRACNEPDDFLSYRPDARAERPAQILNEFTLPPYSMENFGFDADDLATAAANGAVIDNPGIASGLLQLNGNHYLSVTDRGPNIDRTLAVGGGTFKAFPFPQFSPTIVVLKIVTDRIMPTDDLPILNANTPRSPVT